MLSRLMILLVLGRARAWSSARARVMRMSSGDASERKRVVFLGAGLLARRARILDAVGDGRWRLIQACAACFFARRLRGGRGGRRARLHRSMKRQLAPHRLNGCLLGVLNEPAL